MPYFPSGLIDDIAPGIIPSSGAIELTITGTFPIGQPIYGYLGFSGTEADLPLYSGIQGYGRALLSSDGVTLRAVTPISSYGNCIVTLDIDGTLNRYLDLIISPPIFFSKQFAIKKKFQPFYDLGQRDIARYFARSEGQGGPPELIYPLYVAGSNTQIRKYSDGQWSIVTGPPLTMGITAIRVLADGTLVIAAPGYPAYQGSLWSLISGSSTWVKIWEVPYYQYGVEDFPCIIDDGNELWASIRRNGNSPIGRGDASLVSLWSTPSGRLSMDIHPNDDRVLINDWSTAGRKIYWSPKNSPSWTMDTTHPAMADTFGGLITWDPHNENMVTCYQRTYGVDVRFSVGDVGSWIEAYTVSPPLGVRQQNNSPICIRNNGDLYQPINRTSTTPILVRRINDIWNELVLSGIPYEVFNGAWHQGSSYFPTNDTSGNILKVTGDSFALENIAMGTNFRAYCAHCREEG